MVDASAFTAGPAAAGYLYQARLALLLCMPLLKTGADVEVSLEQLDDVAFSEGGNAFELLSVKHHLRRAAWLGDASPDLWKTLRIWARAVADDPSLPSRSRLVLITTSVAPEGSVAAMLRTEDPASRAAKPGLRAAHAALVEVAGSSQNRELAPAFRAFLDLTEKLQLAMLSAVEVVDGQPVLADLDARLEHELRMMAPAGKASFAREMLEGWWWPRVCHALSSATPESIPLAAIDTKLDEIADQLKRDALVAELEHAEPPEEELGRYDEMRFVRQLKVIGLGSARVGFAKRDYYRAYTQRSRWTRQNVVLDEELERFERTLIEEWQPRHASMSDDLDGEEPGSSRLTSEGRRLYGWVETEARYPLRSLTAKFLNVGSFHILADGLRVGWHRDYKALCVDPGAEG